MDIFQSISLVEFKRVYDMLGVQFDSYNGEAFYSDKMDEVVDILRDKGLLTESDGAQVVDLSELNVPPCIGLNRTVRQFTQLVILRRLYIVTEHMISIKIYTLSVFRSHFTLSRYLP